MKYNSFPTLPNSNVVAKTDVLGRKQIEDSLSAIKGKVPNLSIDFLMLPEQQITDSILKSKYNVQRKIKEFELEDSFLQKLSGVIDNLNKFLSALSYKIHYAYQTNKIEERLLLQRHEKLQEFLLEKGKKIEEESPKKSDKSDKEKVEYLKKLLAGMGLVGAAAVLGNLPPLPGSYTKKGAILAKQLMTKYGLTAIQAAAVFGVMSWESSLIPHNVENSSIYDSQEPLPPPYGATYVGYGWPQWTNISNTPGDRLNLFITKYLGGGPGKRGRPATDQDNMNYFTWELDNVPRYSSVIPDLKKQTTVEGAVNSFLNLYEGVPGNRVPERIQRTLGILQEMQKAVGGIVIPELFGRGYTVKYDTDRKNTTLSNFIVDRPTVINMNQINEPLVIIPLEKPIGRTILSILFRPIFDKIEQLVSPIRQSILGKKHTVEEYTAPVNKNQKLTISVPRITNTITPIIDLKSFTETIKYMSNDVEESKRNIIELFDFPSLINVLPQINLEEKKEPEQPLNKIDIKTPDSQLFSPPQNSQELITPIQKSSIDTIDKLSTKTTNLIQDKTTVVIFTRDIYV